MLFIGVVWGERSCPRSATAIHSVAVDRTPNLPIERRKLYHWANRCPVLYSFEVYIRRVFGANVLFTCIAEAIWWNLALSTSLFRLNFKVWAQFRMNKELKCIKCNHTRHTEYRAVASGVREWWPSLCPISCMPLGCLHTSTIASKKRAPLWFLHPLLRNPSDGPDWVGCCSQNWLQAYDRP